MLKQRLCYLLCCLLTTGYGNATANEPLFSRDIDLIYHKEGGYALTMDRVTPFTPNGAAIMMIVSGRWISNHDFLVPQVKDKLPKFATESIINPTELLRRGYTVFFVIHGAEPIFTIPEIHNQISAAIRHISYHAEHYNIDPERIGIMGGSAGGHLALLQATKGLPPGTNPSHQAEQSSRVQAVMAYFPPTDFLNYGSEGSLFVDIMRTSKGSNFEQALDLLDHDPQNFTRTKVTDKNTLTQHYRDISPYYHVSADDPPTLLIHGDADDVVPFQQSERFANRLTTAGVPHKLRRKSGGVHGWNPGAAELALIADWFDKHLTKNKSQRAQNDPEG